MKNDTIYAPSSAIGGAIAVLRVSGPEAKRAVRLFSRDFSQRPRMLTHASAVLQGEIVDECMAVYLPAPHTYTGEDMVEINCHGGMQVVQKLLGMLGSLGFRPAEGGEFTRRAFLNGKMDLSQAEAVMDIINAEAEQSRKAAMLQLHGSVSRRIRETEGLLLDALSGIDAAIDYPDEAEAEAYAALPELLEQSITGISGLITEGRRGRVLRDGLRVCILGKPNVGKSSLMNALLGTTRAIVTASAGTTRDVLDERVSFRGVPVRLLDTAGLREAEDEAERIGVSRAREAMETADVLLIVLDASRPLEAEDRKLLEETADRKRVVLLNKQDIPCLSHWEGGIPVSAKTGEGLSVLQTQILELAAPRESDCGCITNERHIRLLEEALQSLKAAAEATELDCAATDVRDALHCLGGITGTDVDGDVIDRIFSRFCVGK